MREARRCEARPREARQAVIRSAFRVLLVLWAGSLWSLAAWVAITIFHALHDARLAGSIAGRLFSIECYLGLATALIALAMPARRKLGGLYAAAALLACNEFVLKPFMQTAQARGAALGLSFGAWHGTSALLYVIACLAVLLVIWKQDLR